MSNLSKIKIAVNLTKISKSYCVQVNHLLKDLTTEQKSKFKELILQTFKSEIK